MPRLFAIFACSLLLASCGKDTPAPASFSGAAWAKTIDEAMSRAKSSGKPVLLHFYATW